MKKNSKIPENYQTVMPYLILKGAKKFIEWTTCVFIATETHRAMRDEHIIMHAEIMIGECTIMFADCTEQYAIRNADLFIYVDDADATFKKAIEAGASVINEMSDQSYGRSGGVRDPFGNGWWITSIPK
jgi:PhnB protein